MEHVFAIEPTGSYTTFATGDEELDKCREWGLLSERATRTKTFNYKRGGQTWACNVVGFVDSIMIIIEFENGQKHCIHPSYLKEMQATSFGQRGSADSSSEGGVADSEAVAPEGEEYKSAEAALAPAKVKKPATPKEPSAEKPAAAPKEPKKVKLQLPEDKVKMTATVMEFATVANHFTEEDDEVIIYEAVSLLEPEMEIGLAWSSHSLTLKKLELAVGDKLTFDGKIAAKKLLKHPVTYKINNPSKIVKE
jgi:hypothetical protein